jgi:transcriptional regulator with XRE-family HTH domain
LDNSKTNLGPIFDLPLDPMKIRQVLATQIRERMAKKPDLDTQSKLSRAAGVTQSTIWRILDGQVGASVDVVESLARAFGIPVVAMLSNPEESRLLESWYKLSAEDRGKVAAFMQVTISARPSNMPSSKNWMDVQPSGAGMAAAALRGASHPLTGTAEDAEQTEESRPRQQRHSA